MADYVRVDKKLLENCYNFITEVAIRDFKVGRNEDYALARRILNQLVRVLNTE